MSNLHYTGGCHCGGVTFEADLDLDRTITCNCSRCQKLGAVLAFTPRSAFTLKAGESLLSEYRFNKGKITHLFCKACGIEPFAFADAPDGTPSAAVNVNCLDGVDPRALKSHPFDGRSL